MTVDQHKLQELAELHERMQRLESDLATEEGKISRSPLYEKRLAGAIKL